MAIELKEAIAQLKEKDFAIRRETMTALGNWGDASATAAMIELLHDKEWVVRARAAEVLGEMRDPAAVPMLVAVLQDQSRPEMESGIYHVYDCAAKALGKIGTAPAIFTLREMLKSTDMTIRFRAARALLEAGETSAVPALIRLMHAQDLSVRLNAIRMLGGSGAAGAVPALIAMLHVETIPLPIRTAAAEALHKLGDSETLPRKILACSQLVVKEKIQLLERLRHVRFQGGTSRPFSLRYAFPDTRTLCRKVLKESDTASCQGAQAVLNWLDGDRELLRASQPNSSHQSQTLLRPIEGSSPEMRPDTLLIASESPSQVS